MQSFLWAATLAKVVFSIPFLCPNNLQGKCYAHFIEKENEAQREKLLLQSYSKGHSLNLNLVCPLYDKFGLNYAGNGKSSQV